MGDPLPEGRRIWPLENGHFVISARDVWIPGSYENEAAARLAFDFPDEVLILLQEKAKPGPITLTMLEEARKSPKGSPTEGRGSP